MNELQAMRVYARVVEAGTFTRAAETLGLAKSNVSKTIQALEDRLRVKLLIRTTRRVNVTFEGAAFYARAARLLSDFDDLEASIAGARAVPSGKLRLEIGSLIAKMVVIPALGDFSALYPEIQIDLGVDDARIDLLSDNVDCVIRSGKIADSNLVARRLGDMPWMTVASPGYIARYGVPAHPCDIGRKHFTVGFFAGNTRRMSAHEFNRGSETHEINGPYRLSLNNRMAHLEAVLNGHGLSQVPAYVARPLIMQGRLVQMLQDWTRPPVPVNAVLPPTGDLSAKVRAFVDWSTDLFSTYQQLC